MKSWWIKILLTVFVGILYIEAAHAAEVVDSTYIGRYQTNITTRLFLSNKFLSLLHENNISEMTYKQNTPLAVGAGLAVGKTGVKFGVGFDFLRDKSKGETKAYDLQLNNYGRKFLFDLIGQWYEGFYNDQELPNGQYQIHGNMRVLRIGFFGQYIFNNSNFSAAALLNRSERQLRSAGSLLLGGGVYYSEVYSDIAGFFADSTVRLQRMFQIGPSVGYAYTWVLPKGFFISVSASAGINVGYDGRAVAISPAITPRIGLWYDNRDWSATLNYVNNIVYTVFGSSSKLGLSSGVIELGVAYRFEWRPKFLHKIK